MTMLITKPPTTNGYNTIATGNEDPETTATVPHVTARRSTWTTMFAGMLMLSAGGTVWRMQDVDTPNRTTPAAAGLVQSSGNIQTEEVPGRRGGPRTYCTVPPRTATFGGTSITAHFWPVKHPFEVCYKRDDGDAATYCWTGSQCSGDHGAYGCYGCYPKGGSTAAPWLPIDTAEVVNGCDKPCQELYGSSDE